MGCKSSKPDVVSSRAVRRGETDRLVAELRSLGLPSWAPPAPILEEPSLVGAPELKEEISKNPALLFFINDHLDHTIKTLRSLTGVKGCLDRPQHILSTIRRALEDFEKEKAERRNDKKKKKKKKSSNKYSEAVDKLKESRALGDPFAGLNLGEIGEAGALLPQLAKLRQRDHELKKRLRSLKKRRKVWDVAYMAGIVAVLACSVILALAVSPATAAIAAATASATAMKVVEPLFGSVWNRWVGSLQEEKDVVAAMRKMRELAVHELENVRLTFEKLKIDIDAMLDRVDFVIGGEEEEMAVRIGILSGHIMAREVEKGIDGLKDNFDSCSDKIRKAATEFLKMIMKDI